MKQFFLFGLLLFLSACQPVPVVVEPTPQLVRVDVSPSATWILPALDSCARTNGQVDLSVREISTAALDPDTTDLLIRTGGWKSDSGSAFEIGQIRLDVIVHPDSPVDELSAQALADIFSGRVRQWAQLEPSLPTADIQVWLPPAGDEIRDGLQQALLAGEEPTPLARIAPDPQAMLTAVAADEFALGILPSAYLDPTVKAVDSSLEIWLPVLAVTRSEPAGLPRELMICLQNKITK